MKAIFGNPKEGPDLFSHFERWAKLVNMKNKELKAFLDSPLGKVAGLSPQEAKEQGIFSGRVSGRRILKMRAKIGLGGPKDYIKGPRHLEEKWEVALNKWTGPSKDYMNGTRKTAAEGPGTALPAFVDENRPSRSPSPRLRSPEVLLYKTFGM